jgi:transcriptional regulator with XRE-family HTH domain
MGAKVDMPGPFGALLQRYRAVAGLSQEELAERASVSRRGISDLEFGNLLSAGWERSRATRL